MSDNPFAAEQANEDAQAAADIAAARAGLSPAMTYVLDRVRDGDPLDGRSWRAIDALQRRGLIALAKMPATSPVWTLTELGRAVVDD